MTATATTLLPGERRAFAPRTRQTVSQWAEANVVLPPNSAKPGPLRLDNWTPYAREIMDSIGDPTVEQVTIMSAIQVGKTLILLCALGFIVDHDPGDTLLVMPSDRDAADLLKERFLPIVEESERLRAYLTRKRGQSTKHKLRFDRMVLRVVGSHSPAALASKPIRYLWMDEVGKFPPWAGKEADPVSLARGRTQNFPDRKIVLTSTPTTRDDLIWREWSESDQRRYHAPCPHCGGWQQIEWARVKWRKDVPVEQLEEPGNAWLECEHCTQKIHDGQKLAMLQRGRWVQDGAHIEAGQVIGEKPAAHRGYHLNALYSPWVSFGRAAKRFLQAQHDPRELMEWVNHWQGWIWEELAERLEDNALEAAKRPYALRQVDPAAIRLTAGVDVQKDHFLYVVRAWAPGMTSWLVDYGRVETWQGLAGALFSGTFPVVGAPASPRKVRMAFVDIGGHRRDEVVAFCRRWPQTMRPCRGVGAWQYGRLNAPLRASVIDRAPSGQVVQGGLQLWSVEVGSFKDEIARRMALPDGKVGGWMVPREITAEYARQVLSEQRVRERDKRTGGYRERWQLKPGSHANHYLDCEVYAMAAAKMLGMDKISAPVENDEGEAGVEPSRQVVAKVASQPDWHRERKGDRDWIRTKDGWL